MSALLIFESNVLELIKVIRLVHWSLTPEYTDKLVIAQTIVVSQERLKSEIIKKNVTCLHFLKTNIFQGLFSFKLYCQL